MSFDRAHLARLVRDARGGKPAELFEALAPVAAAWARASCRTHGEAEDVLQESLLELYRSIDRLNNDGAVLSWLRRAIRNNAADRARRRAVRREVGIEAAPEHGVECSPADGLDSSDHRRALLAALADLDDGEREMLTLRHDAGLSLAEIAEATGQSVRAVESRLFRARRALRARLQRDPRS